MGSLRYLRAPLAGALLAACLVAALTLTACGKQPPVRLKYFKHAESPDGKRVVFTASCRLGKFGKRLESPVLARSRDDSTTWIQLTDWETLEILGYEWVDDTTLRIRAKPRMKKGPSYFRLDAHEGVKLIWAIE